MKLIRDKKVYDKTLRRVCWLQYPETHNRFNVIWWVVKYRDGLVRNCFIEELREIKS